MSGIVCALIVAVGCIAMQKLDGGGVALTGLFLLAGGSVGFTVRPRAAQQLSTSGSHVTATSEHKQ
jgi:hypothetical protein